MSTILYSFLVIITSVVAAVVLLLRIKKNHILATKSFFWHYMFGFVLFSLAHLPIFLINLRINISYNTLLVFYIISFFAIFIALQLFLRGTNCLFIKERIFTTILPIIAFPFFAILTLFLLFFSQIGSILVYTVLMWGFLIPINLYLTSIFFYFFINGAPFDSTKRRPYTLFLSFGWLMVLVSHVVLWLSAITYAPEFWILKETSFKWWFFARAVAYFLIFLGAMFFSDRHYKISKSFEKT